jgi:hypothetical protein
MGIRLLSILCLAVMSFLAVVESFAQRTAPQPLITQPIVETQLLTLRGNTHPLARPQFDIGVAPPNLPMQRMLLVLRRDPQQEFGLHKLLDDQQDKASPNFHRWLSPDEFGVQFGPSDQDLQLVTGWLQNHGFQVSRVSNGRSVIEFSGVEAQVEQAFHTQIHQYSVNGQVHWANASDPQIPTALAPAVAGIRSLHNFPAHPMLRVLGAMSREKATGQINPAPPPAQTNSARPLITIPIGGGNFCGVQPSYCYGVGPYDFATIYNLSPLWNASPPIDGTGQKIAIVGETDIDPQDVADFRNFFGLPPVTLHVTHDGPAPGILTNGEETEADLDVEWSSAVAKGATIEFVVAQTTETTWGVDLAALHIIDHNLAPVMSESYGFCELGLGQAGNQFYSSLWAQAAAQGITVMLSAGDGGSAGCDDFNILGPAVFGLQVSGFASTPFNVAVGGTDFYDWNGASPYWSTTNNSTTQASALKYIPETTWDDSCTNPIFGSLGFSTNAETNCNNSQLVQAGFVNILGGSGGKSGCTNSDGQHPSSCSGGYPKPSWQVAPGVPADGVRDLPDVSLFAAVASPSGSFYIVCEADAVSGSSCDPSNPFTGFLGIGGTSASSPAFAGVMALVNQQMQARQGNANYVLYKLAAQQNASSCNSTTGSGAGCVFNDVTVGTIAMPCKAGSPNCTVKTTGHQYGILSGYSTGSSYDLATGLGSVNVANLVNNWNSVVFRSSSTSLTLSPTTNITHGQNVTLTANVTAGSPPSSPSPSGRISLLTSSGVGVGSFALNGSGTASSTTNLLPGGSYNVTARYGGDSTYGGSDSAPVSITIGKENSSTQIELVTFGWQGNLISANASTVVYGSPYLLRVDVLNSAGALCQNNGVVQSGCPTGTVNLTDNGSPLDGGTFGLNSFGYTEDQIVQFPGGNNSVKAQYAGDSSYNASSATKTYNVTPAPTSISVPGGVQSGTVGYPFNTSVTVQAQSFGAAPGGTVSFLANGTPVSGTVSYQATPGSLANPTATLYAYFTSSSSAFASAGNYTIKASYSGDANYGASTSSATSASVKYPAPGLSLNVSPSSITPGSSVTITAVVDTNLKNVPVPGGTVSFMDWLTGIAVTGTPTYSSTTDSSGNVAFQASLTFIPQANMTIAASYGGDSNYPSASWVVGNGITIAGSDFALVPFSSSINVTQGGTNSLTLFIEGQSAYSGIVNFSSASCTGLPRESSCSFSPTSVTGAGWTSLSFNTTAPHATAAKQKWGLGQNSFVLAFCLPFATLMIPLPGLRHRVRALILSLVSGLLLFVIACGGGGGGGGGQTDPGTPRGSYPITVTATSGTGSGAITHSANFTLVVQ